ncbi:Ubiquitin carboxyl-terminal hydrolase, partial [Phytophthora megakarya]
MPEAEFPDDSTIQTFLRGSEVSMTTEEVSKFKEFQEAQNYAATYMRNEQNHCSFEMEGAAINGKAFVTITKTRGWFLAQQKMLVQYQAELRLLTDQYGDELKIDGGVFTALIEDIGVQGVQVEELYTLDEQQFADLSPVYGLVFLFKYEATHGEDSDTPTFATEDDGLFFAKQVISNACATQAILSILLNSQDINLGD